MPCSVPTHADPLWSLLLDLRRFLASPEAVETAYLDLCPQGDSWGFRPSETVDASRSVRLCLDGEATAEAIERLPSFLQIYLPLVLGAHAARRAGRVFVTAHIAQSIDGRIACSNGHSQWIGNDANLHHAHRLRALHDAVLVGRNTVERDDPQLTVRHVEGESPSRIVLNGSASTLLSRTNYRVFENGSSTVVCRRSAARELSDADRRGVGVVGLEPNSDGRIPTSSLCESLVERGIHSLFVEGGGRTLSGFLADRCIDMLHVHIAPLILGSGVASFSLPEIAAVHDALRLRPSHFTMDGELLLTSALDR